VNITIIGTGYVGLVTAATLANAGNDVVALDVDEAKIRDLRDGRLPIFEPGLDELVAGGVAAGRLEFDADYERVAGAEVVFIAVGTPQRPDGTADLSQVEAATDAMAGHLAEGAVVAVKSTVPVGTTRTVAERLGSRASVAANPEFLREGSAVADAMHPDRIVIGAIDERGGRTLQTLYAHHAAAGVPILVTNPETAELIKYASNAFLSTKLSFINEVSDLCEVAGASIEDVARGIGLDPRIGPSFLRAGPGFGGSCLPKDLQALLHTGNRLGTPSRILRAALDVNEQRKRRMVDKVAATVGGDLNGVRIGALGLTYKANTDDLRESPAVEIVRLLHGRGALVRAYDPQGMPAAKRVMPGIEYAEDAYGAATGAQVVVILTEWPEFASLDMERLAGVMSSPVMVDLRNLIDPEVALRAGFRYSSLGRPDVS